MLITCSPRTSELFRIRRVGNLSIVATFPTQPRAAIAPRQQGRRFSRKIRMSDKTTEPGTRLSLTRIKPKPKRAKVRRTPAVEQALAPRQGLLAHAWIDRDLSWLDFNRRVLHEALDGAHAVARTVEVSGDLHLEPR